LGNTNKKEKPIKNGGYGDAQVIVLGTPPADCLARQGRGAISRQAKMAVDAPPQLLLPQENNP